jgi:arsenate reductase
MNDKVKKPRVLFLCTHNTARSQMAEAFLRKYAGDRFEAYSAGFEPQEIHPYTRQVMEERGFDLADQRAKSLTEYLTRMHFGYLITVCARAEERCPIFPGVGERIYWPFEDPTALEGTEAEKLDKFREVRDQVEERVREWLRSHGETITEEENE